MNLLDLNYAELKKSFTIKSLMLNLTGISNCIKTLNRNWLKILNKSKMKILISTLAFNLFLQQKALIFASISIHHKNYIKFTSQAALIALKQIACRDLHEISINLWHKFKIRKRHKKFKLRRFTANSHSSLTVLISKRLHQENFNTFLS